MAIQTFRYRRLSGDATPRPYLRLWIEIAGSIYRLPMLVDSGADTSVLPLAFAKEVGIGFDPAKPRDAMGAGGPYKDFDAIAGPMDFSTDAGPVTLKGPRLNERMTAFGLLGRADFFSQYRICFDDRTIQFTIEAYGPGTPKPRKHGRR